jgi:hypothetical protein
MKKFLLSLSMLSAATLVPTSPSSAAVAPCTRPQAGLVRGDRACVRINGRWSWRQLAPEAATVLTPVEPVVTPPTTAPLQAPTTALPAPTSIAVPTAVVAILPDPCKLTEPALPAFGSALNDDKLTMTNTKGEATFRLCQLDGGRTYSKFYLSFTKDKTKAYGDDYEASRYLPNPDGSFALKDGDNFRLFTVKKGVRIFFFSQYINTNERLAAAQALFNSVVAQI